MAQNMLVKQLRPCLRCGAPVDAWRLFTTHQQIAEVLEVGCVHSTVLQLLPQHCRVHKQLSNCL